MKVYVYYLKDTNRLYAYTNEKSYDKMFRKQRDSKSFVRISLDLDNGYDNISFVKISMNNKLDKYELNPYPLTDGDNEIDIMMTHNEYVSLMESCEYIENFLYTMRYEKDSYYSLNDKEIKALKLLTSLNDTCVLNTFRIFYRLFDFTFDENIDMTGYTYYSL